MTELPKRELGRTGLQVTMLGYGAMELRGAPRGRDVTESQSETVLNAVAVSWRIVSELLRRYPGWFRAIETHP